MLNMIQITQIESIYSVLSISGHSQKTQKVASQKRPPSLMWPQISAVSTIRAFLPFYLSNVHNFLANSVSLLGETTVVPAI